MCPIEALSACDSSPQPRPQVSSYILRIPTECEVVALARSDSTPQGCARQAAKGWGPGTGGILFKLTVYSPNPKLDRQHDRCLRSIRPVLIGQFGLFIRAFGLM